MTMPSGETRSITHPEWIQIADAVARERSIDREIVIEAIEQAIQTAAQRKYGQERDIRATIEPRSGELRLIRVRRVVEEAENKAVEIALAEAQSRDAALAVGDELTDPLPPFNIDEIGRLAAQAAKQVVVQRMRDAERDRQFEEYKDRVGEVVNGMVKRDDYGGVIVDLGRAEGVMRRDESLPRERFRDGDRLRALIYDVRRELRGPQIFLSRSRPEFMAQLFRQEVPEVYDGIIEIRAVARDPGSRAKIAVLSNDSSIDPVGACVGMRGSRVRAVVAELQDEKIDIIQWNADPATFIVNALAPAEVTKVVMDEESHRIEVVVPDDQLSLAIGRRGQNVRLASQLTGWAIDIMTEGQESERRNEEMRAASGLFMEALNVDDVIAHLLVTEGFTDVESVAFMPVEELAGIEGFDEEGLAEELRARARDYLVKRDEEHTRRRVELGVEDGVTEVHEALTPAMHVALGENGVKTLDDLADLARDELIEIVGEGALDEETAGEVVMAARRHWFPDDPDPGAEAETAAPPAGDGEAQGDGNGEDDDRGGPAGSAPDSTGER